ncbi:hypothetical protein [Dyella sp. C11]|uniref:hypothetical protein n=1 Tax=Dyella sp. C11 TaxID=2126991 RepID=UPI000D64B853|nr:hypothetical protein [Dyella sp. C11]
MTPVSTIAGLGFLLLTCGAFVVAAQAQDNVAAPATAVAAQTAGATAAPTAALANVVSGIPTSDAIAGWSPVGEDTLDQTRGGFDVGNGLVASFGIDRAVYVNGNLVTTTSFNVPDIAHMTPAQATAMQTALSTVQVTQIGPNNTFDPSSLAPGQGATVIQNTLNNQHIQSITTINATTNALSAFREGSLQEALQQSQLQSLGH